MRIAESIEVVEGSLKIVRFEGRPFWQARIYDPRTRNSVTRSLRTKDRAEAQTKAIQLWSDIAPKIAADLPVAAQSIESLVLEYYDAQQKRIDAGLVKPGTLKDIRSQLKPFLTYCALHGIRELISVKPYSFNSFVEWRRDESLVITTGTAGVLKPTSLNKGIREVRAWWKWMKSKHLVNFEIELMEVTMRKEQEKDRNVAIPDKHWELIEREIHRRAFLAKPSKKTQPGHLYFRRTFYYLLMLLVTTGLRPQEATNLLRWKDFSLKKKDPKQQDQFTSACVLSVVNPGGKGSRQVVSHGGMLLQAFKKYASDWRHAHGYKALRPDDLVFCYPATNDVYPYSQWGLEFRKTLKHLGLQGKGYTIRSTRSTYITDSIAKGVSPYILARNTGHSIEIMKKHYEQLGIEELADALL